MIFVNTTMEKDLKPTRPPRPPGNVNQFPLTWWKESSFSCSRVWMSVQLSSEENSFISMFSLIASSGCFLSPFILSSTGNLFVSFGFRSLPFSLSLSCFLSCRLEFYLLGIKKKKKSRWPLGDCSLPNIHQLRSYCSKLRAIRVQHPDWFKGASLVIGLVLGLSLVGITMDFCRPL